MTGDQIEVLTDRGNTFRVTEDNQGECRSCGEPIIWTVTARGKKMPVDVPTTPGEPTTSHFATCPDHEQWRKS
jgi:hypothetical protein